MALEPPTLSTVGDVVDFYEPLVMQRLLELALASNKPEDVERGVKAVNAYRTRTKAANSSDLGGFEIIIIRPSGEQVSAVAQAPVDVEVKDVTPPEPAALPEPAPPTPFPKTIPAASIFDLAELSSLLADEEGD